MEKCGHILLYPYLKGELALQTAQKGFLILHDKKHLTSQWLQVHSHCCTYKARGLDVIEPQLDADPKSSLTRNCLLTNPVPVYGFVTPSLPWLWLACDDPAR